MLLLLMCVFLILWPQFIFSYVVFTPQSHPDIKWVENAKTLFKVRIHVASTIYAQVRQAYYFSLNTDVDIQCKYSTGGHRRAWFVRKCFLKGTSEQKLKCFFSAWWDREPGLLWIQRLDLGNGLPGLMRVVCPFMMYCVFPRICIYTNSSSTASWWPQKATLQNLSDTWRYLSF